MSMCRSCRAPIIWATSMDGRAIPLDAQPIVGGNLRLDQRPGRLLARHVTVAERDELAGRGVALYRSHFASCPNANEHRRR